MADGRLVQVVIWKQGAMPDPAYTRQVLRVAAPAALGPVGPDGEPVLAVPVRRLAGPETWPDDFWTVALSALHLPVDYSDPARYDLSGWQGTDARDSSHLFVASVYEKPAVAGLPTPPPAFAPAPPPAAPSAPAASHYDAPGPGTTAPPAPTYPDAGPPPGSVPPAYLTPPAPTYAPPPYPPPSYSAPPSPAPGYRAAPAWSPPGPPMFAEGAGTVIPADAYPGQTGVAGADLADGDRGFYGGFGPRVLAGLVDAVIVGVILFVPFLCTLAFLSAGESPTGSANSSNNGLGGLALCGFCCLGFVLIGLYYAGFWLWRGQTPGKMLLGLRVVGPAGQPPHVGQVLLRVVGYFMSALLLGLGFLLIAFDEARQGLHDHIAGTYVVPTRPPARHRPATLPGYPPEATNPADLPPPPPPPPAPTPSPPAAALYTPATTPPQWSAASTGPVQWSAASTASTSPVQWSAPPIPAAPSALPPATPTPVAPSPAPPAPAIDPEAAQHFRHGLELLTEGVREPGGGPTLLTIEPEAAQAATEAFTTATERAPDSAIYHYFLGVARRYGAGFGAALPDFQQAAQLDPDYWEAQLQVYFGSRWRDAFAYPEWSARATALPPALAALRPPQPGTRLVIVREGGAKTVAALCYTPRAAWLTLPTADMPARIHLVPAHSPYGAIVAFYLALRDNPTNPYRGETFLNPAEALPDDGDATQLSQNLLLQLARQNHTYLIFVDEDGALLHNRRLAFDPPTLANLAAVAQDVRTIAGAGHPLSTDRFTQAATWHMGQYALESVAIQPADDGR